MGNLWSFKLVLAWCKIRALKSSQLDTTDTPLAFLYVSDESSDTNLLPWVVGPWGKEMFFNNFLHNLKHVIYTIRNHKSIEQQRQKEIIYDVTWRN